MKAGLGIANERGACWREAHQTVFFNDTATTEIYTLSLHDALPICGDLGDVAHLIGEVAAHRVHRIGEVLPGAGRSEEHTSELQSPDHLVCRLLLEKKLALAVAGASYRLRRRSGLF